MADMYKRIDELLAERGITGAKLSADLGMSRSFMTELRKGRAKGITLETAQKIADYFSVSVDYLLGNVNDPFFQLDNKRILADINSYDDEKKSALSEADLTEDELRILSAFREMSPERQKALADLLGISDS